MIEFAKANHILVVHDFAYSELIFDQHRQISFMLIPGAKEVGIEFNSLSKTFNMAGCRIGYVVGNPEALQILGTSKSQIDYGTFYPILKAAEKALTEEAASLAEQVKEYEARRDALLSGWKREAGKFRNLCHDVCMGPNSRWLECDFAFELIEKARVAAVPGDAFGKEGEGYVRMALV